MLGISLFRDPRIDSGTLSNTFLVVIYLSIYLEVHIPLLVDFLRNSSYFLDTIRAIQTPLTSKPPWGAVYAICPVADRS